MSLTLYSVDRITTLREIIPWNFETQQYDSTSIPSEIYPKDKMNCKSSQAHI